MSTVDQLLCVKGRHVHTISKRATVFEAIGRMVAHDIGALLVLDEGDEPCGIITERDYLKKVALEGRSSKTTAVDEVCSRDLIFVEPGSGVEECMALMTEERIRHLPVLEGHQLVGLVSIGDVLRHLALERQSTIIELTGYIQGQYA